MGANSSDNERSPSPKDLDGWRRFIAEGRHSDMKPENLVAAIQDLGPATRIDILNPLLNTLTAHAIKFLRRQVGTNHPNGGQDIIDRAHHDLILALFEPASADGKGFREAYYSRLSFRLKDAIAKELRQRRTEQDVIVAKAKRRDQHPSKATLKTPSSDYSKQEMEDDQIDADDDEHELADAESAAISSFGNATNDDDDASPSRAHYDPELTDREDKVFDELSVRLILEKLVPDERKRQAYWLAKMGVPAKSKRTLSIAQALDIDESTARSWIEEVTQILIAKVGAQNDR